MDDDSALPCDEVRSYALAVVATARFASEELQLESWGGLAQRGPLNVSY